MRKSISVLVVMVELLIIGCGNVIRMNDETVVREVNYIDEYEDVPLYNQNKLDFLEKGLPMHSEDLIQFSSSLNDKNFDPIGVWINQYKLIYSGDGYKGDRTLETEKLDIQKGDGKSFPAKYVRTKRSFHSDRFFLEEKILAVGKVLVRGHELIFKGKINAADIGHREARSLKELEETSYEIEENSIEMTQVILFEFDVNQNVIKLKKETLTPPKGAKPSKNSSGAKFLQSIYITYSYDNGKFSSRKEIINDSETFQKSSDVNDPFLKQKGTNTYEIRSGKIGKGIFKRKE